MQEPGRRDGKQQRPAPPVGYLVEIAQHQPDRSRRQQRHQHRYQAGEEDRLAEQHERQHLQVDAGAQVVVAAVLEIGGQEDLIAAEEVISHQVGCQHGLHGLVGEEVDWEAGQADHPGAEIYQQ